MPENDDAIVAAMEKIAVERPTPVEEPPAAETPQPEPTPAEPPSAAPTPEPVEIPKPVEAAVEPAKAPELPPTTPATPAPPVDYESILKERTGGKIKSFDELIAIVDKAEALEKSKIEFADPILAKANEFVKNKQGTAQDFIAIQSVNFDEMEAGDVHAEAMWKGNPNLTEEDIEYDLNRDYKVSEWNLEDPSQDSEEVKYLKGKFFRDAEVKKQELKAYQSEWLVKPSAEDPEKHRREAVELQNRYVQDASDAVAKIPAFELKLNDTDTFRYELKEEQKKALVDDFREFITQDPTKKIGLYTKEGGLNMARIAEMYRWEKYGHDMINKAAEQAVNKGVKKAVEQDINNAGFDPARQTPAPPKLTGIQEVAKAAESIIKDYR